MVTWTLGLLGPFVIMLMLFKSTVTQIGMASSFLDLFAPYISILMGLSLFVSLNISAKTRCFNYVVTHNATKAQCTMLLVPMCAFFTNTVSFNYIVTVVVMVLRVFGPSVIKLVVFNYVL